MLLLSTDPFSVPFTQPNTHRCMVGTTTTAAATLVIDVCMDGLNRLPKRIEIMIPRLQTRPIRLRRWTGIFSGALLLQLLVLYTGSILALVPDDSRIDATTSTDSNNQNDDKGVEPTESSSTTPTPNNDASPMKKIAAPWQFIDGYYHLDFGGEAQTETAAASTEQNDDDDDDETDDDGSSGIPPFRAQIRSRLVQASLYLQKRRQEQVDREEEESDNDDDENEKYSTNDEGTEIEDCILHHELCTEWAVRGECEANPAYMKANCAPVCFSCEYLTFQGRCPLSDSISEQNVWRHAGDLHRMFERIVSVATNNSSRYADDDDAVRIQSQRGTNKTLAIAAISSVPLLTPPYPFQVLSQPTRQTNMNEAVVENTGIVGESATAQYDESDSDPWVVVVDDFLTEQECAALIELGSELGYERSTGLNRALKADGTHGSSVVEGRTSSNTWCKDDCFTNSTTKRVLAKIEQLTGIPDDNSEFLQLLHYDVGQFYQTHHDFIDFHLDRGQGVRIVTVFLYLNDVEEGGGTNFPKLNLTVEAKRGRALIWPSVLNSSPDRKDPRTDHQALPVIKGFKYGANAWLHQRDFKSPYQHGCS